MRRPWLQRLLLLALLGIVGFGMDYALHKPGVDVKGGKLERLCSQ